MYDDDEDEETENERLLRLFVREKKSVTSNRWTERKSGLSSQTLLSLTHRTSGKMSFSRLLILLPVSHAECNRISVSSPDSGCQQKESHSESGMLRKKKSIVQSIPRHGHRLLALSFACGCRPTTLFASTCARDPEKSSLLSLLNYQQLSSSTQMPLLPHIRCLPNSLFFLFVAHLHANKRLNLYNSFSHFRNIVSCLSCACVCLRLPSLTAPATALIRTTAFVWRMRTGACVCPIVALNPTDSSCPACGQAKMTLLKSQTTSSLQINMRHQVFCLLIRSLVNR